MKDIGKRIREIRKNKKISMQALANEIGVAVQTIQKYETGIIKEIPLSQLEKIAQVLDVPVFELISNHKKNTSVLSRKTLILNLDIEEKENLIIKANKYVSENYEKIKNILVDDFITVENFYNFPFTLNVNSITLVEFCSIFKIIDEKYAKELLNKIKRIDEPVFFDEFDEFKEKMFNTIQNIIRTDIDFKNYHIIEELLKSILNLDNEQLEKVKEYIEFLENKKSSSTPK